VLFGEADGYKIAIVSDDETLVRNPPTPPGGTPMVFDRATGIRVGAGKTVELNTAGGAVTQTQDIIAPNGIGTSSDKSRLLLNGQAEYTLANGTNQFQQFATLDKDVAASLVTVRVEGDLELLPQTGLTPSNVSVLPSAVSYRGIERGGNVDVTAGGVITFDGSFVAKGPAGALFTVSSTKVPDQVENPDLEEEIGRFISKQGKLYSPSGNEIDRDTGDFVDKGGNDARRLRIAQAVITQSNGGKVVLEDGVNLRLLSKPIQGSGGSIVLGNRLNELGNASGASVSARSAGSAGIGTPQFVLGGNRAAGAETLPILSIVELKGIAVNVGDSKQVVDVPLYNARDPSKRVNVGIEADLVRLSSKKLVTDSNYVVARYSATPSKTRANQLPGLAITMQAYENDGDFGSTSGDETALFAGEGNGIKVVVGYPDVSKKIKSLGYVALFPSKIYPNGQAVDEGQSLQILLNRPAYISFTGPVKNEYYSLTSFNVPDNPRIVDNGKAPLLGGATEALSSVVSLQEKLRREQVERSVSTENVARDLREGVIVEVGAGPAATTGSEGIRLPQICPPSTGGLACAAGGK
jgi:hypothetical protein